MESWLWASFWSGWDFNGFFFASDRWGCKGGGWVGGWQGAAAPRPGAGCRLPVGVTWALWLPSRVLRHKEPTLRSQVSDSGRVRKSGDCKAHPTWTPPHLQDTSNVHIRLYYYTCEDIWTTRIAQRITLILIYRSPHFYIKGIISDPNVSKSVIPPLKIIIIINLNY